MKLIISNSRKGRLSFKFQFANRHFHIDHGNGDLLLPLSDWNPDNITIAIGINIFYTNVRRVFALRRNKPNHWIHLQNLKILLPGIYSNHQPSIEHILRHVFNLENDIKEGAQSLDGSMQMQSGGWRCLVRLDLYGRGFLQQMQVGLTNIEF